jgi:hypothetical protein
MGLIQKAFSDIVTFSRASNATRIGPTGRVEYAPHNLLTYSEQFDNAAWITARASVVANAVAAPNGTVTADKLVEDTTASNNHRIRQDISTSAIPYTFTVFCKAAERGYVALYNLTTLSGQVFDLITGTVGVVVGTAPTSALITSVGNGWYRCSITVTATAATNSWSLYILPSNTSTLTYTGDGTSGIYLWGAQLAVGPYALDYTPTTSAAVYGPRFDFDPVTLAAKGLLIEEQRTNLLTYSEDFSNAAWSIINSTITSNTIVAPNGTVTGDKFFEGSNSNAKELYRSYSASALTYTLSFYAKSDGTRNVIRASIATAGLALGGGTYFNVGNGTNTGATNYGATTGTVVGMSSVGNGWYKCFVTVTATAATYYVDFMLANDSNNINYAGNGFSGIYIWGAQLEAGSFATSYIPTLASAVTRSADVATINTLSPFFNATEGTMFAQFDSAASGTNTIAAFDDNTANENYRLRNVGTDPKFTVTDGGVDQCDINGGTIAANTVYNFAAAYKANDFAVCIAGGTVQTDTSGTLPTVDRLRIGTSQAGNYLNGHVRRFAYYPRRLANAELQALTA